MIIDWLFLSEICFYWAHFPVIESTLLLILLFQICYAYAPSFRCFWEIDAEMNRMDFEKNDDDCKYSLL